MPKKRLLDQVRDILPLEHLRRSTEKASLYGIKRFTLFHEKRHPRDRGEAEIQSFLSHLAVRGKVAASTQNSALNALVFLYKKVLNRELEDFRAFARARRPGYDIRTVQELLGNKAVRKRP